MMEYLQQNQEIKNILNTDVWRTIEIIDRPLDEISFVEVEPDSEEPEEAKEIRINTWLGKLEEKQQALQNADASKKYIIDDDPDTGLPSLYEDGGEKKRKMWAGTTVTLARSGMKKEFNGGLEIPVFPMSYTNWIACYNPSYSQVFIEKQIELPYAGFGISVLMESSDGLIPLTRRGLETPVYPGMLYSPGGGPKPRQTSVSAILEEIVEETGLESGKHFDPGDLKALAIVEDSRFAGSLHARPELIAFLPLKIPYLKIEEIHWNKVAKTGKEADVWALEPVSTNLNSLQSKILFDGRQMCPPTEAGLAQLVRTQIFNKTESPTGEISDFVDKLNRYKRSPFSPPLERLV